MAIVVENTYTAIYKKTTSHDITSVVVPDSTERAIYCFIAGTTKSDGDVKYVSGINWNTSEAFSKVGTGEGQYNSQTASVWRLIAPTNNTTATLTITFDDNNSNWDGGSATVLVLSGVDQTTSDRGWAFAGNVTTNFDPTLTFSTTVTGDITVDCMCLGDAISSGAPTEAGEATTTILADNTNSRHACGSARGAGDGTSVGHGWTPATNNDWAMAGTVIIEAAGVITYDYTRVSDARIQTLGTDYTRPSDTRIQTLGTDYTRPSDTRVKVSPQADYTRPSDTAIVGVTDYTRTSIAAIKREAFADYTRPSDARIVAQTDYTRASDAFITEDNVVSASDDGSFWYLGRTNRKVFQNPRGLQRYYSFYINKVQLANYNTNLTYEWSSDGVTWDNAPVNLYAASNPSAYTEHGGDFGVKIYDTGTVLDVYVVFVGLSDTLIYKKGTISDASSTISWSADQTILTINRVLGTDGSDSPFSCDITRTYSGELVVVYTEDVTAVEDYRDVKGVGSNGDGATPTWGTPATLYTNTGNSLNQDKDDVWVGCVSDGYTSSHPDKLYIYFRSPNNHATDYRIRHDLPIWDYVGDQFTNLGSTGLATGPNAGLNVSGLSYNDRVGIGYRLGTSGSAVRLYDFAGGFGSADFYTTFGLNANNLTMTFDEDAKVVYTMYEDGDQDIQYRTLDWSRYWAGTGTTAANMQGEERTFTWSRNPQWFSSANRMGSDDIVIGAQRTTGDDIWSFNITPQSRYLHVDSDTRIKVAPSDDYTRVSDTSILKVTDIQLSSDTRIKTLGTDYTRVSDTKIILVTDIQLLSDARIKATTDYTRVSDTAISAGVQTFQVDLDSDVRIQTLGTDYTRTSDAFITQDNLVSAEDDGSFWYLGRTNRKTFRNPRGLQRYYSFYMRKFISGNWTTALSYEWSSDGISWDNTPVDIINAQSGSSPFPEFGGDFAVKIYDTGTLLDVYLVVVDSVDRVRYFKGTISDASSTISWGTLQPVVGPLNRIFGTDGSDSPFSVDIVRTYNAELVITYTEDVVSVDNYRDLKAIGSNGDGASPTWGTPDTLYTLTGSSNNKDKDDVWWGVAGPYSSSYPDRFMVFGRVPNNSLTIYAAKLVRADWDYGTDSFSGVSPVTVNTGLSMANYCSVLIDPTDRVCVAYHASNATGYAVERYLTAGGFGAQDSWNWLTGSNADPLSLSIDTSGATDVLISVYGNSGSNNLYYRTHSIAVAGWPDELYMKDEEKTLTWNREPKWLSVAENVVESELSIASQRDTGDDIWHHALGVLSYYDHIYSDTRILKASDYTLTSDARIKNTYDYTRASDTAIAGTATYTIDLDSDARIKREAFADYTRVSDTRIIKTQELTYTSDTRILTTTDYTRLSDARIKTTTDYTRLSDTAISSATSPVIDIVSDAAIKREAFNDYTRTADTRIKREAITDYTRPSDARIKNTFQTDITSDTRIQALAQETTEISDARIKISPSDDYTRVSDARIVLSSDYTLLSNATIFRGAFDDKQIISDVRIQTLATEVTKVSDTRIKEIGRAWMFATNVRIRTENNLLDIFSSSRVKVLDEEITYLSDAKIIVAIDVTLTSISTVKRFSFADHTVLSNTEIAESGLGRQVQMASSAKIVLAPLGIPDIYAKVKKLHGIKVKARTINGIRATTRRVRRVSK
jgi:hypothetical protein